MIHSFISFIPDLKRRGAVQDDLGRVLERPAGLVLTLRGDHFGPSVPRSLGLGSHGPLEIFWHSDILHLDTEINEDMLIFFVSSSYHLNPLHKHAPAIGGFIEAGLHLMGDGLPVCEDVPEVPGAQHVPQGGGGQQLSRARIVINIGHGAGGVLKCQIK